MLHAMIFEDGGAVITNGGAGLSTHTASLSADEVDALRVAFAAEKASAPIPQPVPWDVNTPLIVVGDAGGLFPGTAVRVCMNRRSLRHGREYMVADSGGGRAWVAEAALSPCVDWSPAAVPTPVRFKRGDRVRVVDDLPGSRLHKGDTGVITGGWVSGLSAQSSGTYMMRVDGDSDALGVVARRVERVS